MDSERRYTDDEVAEILDRATDTSAQGNPLASSGTGLTLSELHDIGAEVGIPKEVITRAASSLDTIEPVVAPERHFLGAKIGVGRTVYLDRRLTEAEWHRLVVDLRETFDARGNVREEGAFKQWTNSRLQALVEPTDSGERVRLKTLKGNARVQLATGSSLFGVGSVLAALSTFAGVSSIVHPETMVLMLLGGAAMYVTARIRLPGWARTREEQMEGVIKRLTAAVEAADADGNGPDGT